MSKAFTSEETPDGAPVVRAPPRLAPGEVRYVTPEGQARLRAELTSLLDDRPALLRADAPDRVARLAVLDARVAALQATLSVLTVLGPEVALEGRAGFGTWVTVEDDEGARATWRIVGPDEADPPAGRVSAASPLGRALMGLGPGDVAAVRRPGGDRELTVVAISRRAPGGGD